jgi:hypothetical protein
MVRAAAQRDDRCLAPSPTLMDGAAQKVAAKLIAAKLVREIKAKAGTPVWRRDGEGGQPLALKLTAAGLKAIAVNKETAAPEAIVESTSSVDAAAGFQHPFSPDGSLFASSAADAELYDIRVEDLSALACQIAGRNLTADEVMSSQRSAVPLDAAVCRR